MFASTNIMVGVLLKSVQDYSKGYPLGLKIGSRGRVLASLGRESRRLVWLFLQRPRPVELSHL